MFAFSYMWAFAIFDNKLLFTSLNVFVIIYLVIIVCYNL